MKPWAVVLALVPFVGSAQDAGVPMRDAGIPPSDVAGDWRESAATADLLETLTKEGGFTRFLKAIADAQLTDTLREPGPFTVLAPTDEAFARLKKPEQLKRVLLLHVMPGRLSLAELRKLRNGDKLPTLLEGRRLKLTVKGTQVKLEKASFVKRELSASNGVVVPIDTVLMP